MKQHYIYLTTNLLTNMKYIGKHFGELDDNYLGSGTILKKAIDKYGKENFSKEILFISSSDEENCKKEKEYIQLFNAVSNPMFYNLHEGGSGGNTTAGYTPEQKEALKRKLSEANAGSNNGMYGKHHTTETKQFLSFWAEFGRDNSVYRTEEFRQKMSELTIGENNGMYGRHHSEESKQKMSENRKGKTLGEKNGMYGKKGDNAINGKTIEMYDEDNNLVRVFNAKTAVLEFLNLKGHSGLDKAIKNNTIYKGYYWKQINKCRD